MAKRVPPGEKPFSPVKEALVRSVLQPEGLSEIAQEESIQGARERPIELGDYLDEIGRGAFTFTQPGMKRVVIDLTQKLYERLKQVGEERGQKPNEFIRLLIEQELEKEKR